MDSRTVETNGLLKWTVVGCFFLDSTTSGLRAISLVTHDHVIHALVAAGGWAGMTFIAFLVATKRIEN